MESIAASDVPKPRRRRKSTPRPQQSQPRGRLKKYENSDRPNKKRFNKSGTQNQNKRQKLPRSGRVFSEEFDIEDDSQNVGNRVSEEHKDSRDDAKFNTEKHHKRQHKF